MEEGWQEGGKRLKKEREREGRREGGRKEAGRFVKQWNVYPFASQSSAPLPHLWPASTQKILSVNCENLIE